MDEYTSKLESMKKKLGQEGDIETAAKVQAEARHAKPTIPTEIWLSTGPQGPVPVITYLPQDLPASFSYKPLRQAYDECEAKFKVAYVPIEREYLSKLETLKKKLGEDGDIDGAMQVLREYKRFKHVYEADQAALLAANAKGVPPPPAANEKNQKVAAPASDIENAVKLDAKAEPVKWPVAEKIAAEFTKGIPVANRGKSRVWTVRQLKATFGEPTNRTDNGWEEWTWERRGWQGSCFFLDDGLRRINRTGVEATSDCLHKVYPGERPSAQGAVTVAPPFIAQALSL